MIGGKCHRKEDRFAFERGRRKGETVGQEPTSRGVTSWLGKPQLMQDQVGKSRIFSTWKDEVHDPCIDFRVASLELSGNGRPRGMTILDRIPLIALLFFIPGVLFLVELALNP